jgi:hypothetical protein
MILLRTAKECHGMRSKKLPLHFTLSCFWAVDSNLETQGADFLTRPKSSVRVAWTIPNSCKFMNS